ncbi:g9799 [Coccomyxa elongata]
MRVYCAQEVPRSVHARITPARITGAVLTAMLAFTGPVFADGDVLTDELPKVEEELSSITNPEEQESAAEELGALESEATLADEQIQTGGLLDDAPSIKDQLEALKSAFGLQ